MFTSRRIALLLVPFAAVLGLATPAPTASADIVDGLCTAGLSTQRFHPGLTFEDRHIGTQQDGVLLGCAATENPRIHSGTFRFVGSGTANCLTDAIDGKFEFKWYEEAVPETGPVIGTSTVELGLALVLRPIGQTADAATGTVTGGNTFVGDLMTYSEVLLSGINAIQCATTGVTRQDGVSTGIVFVG